MERVKICTTGGMTTWFRCTTHITKGHLLLHRFHPRIPASYHSFPPISKFSPPPPIMCTSKKQPASKSKVLVLGSGNFGSCLASHLGDVQHQVYLWCREASIVKYFNEHHKNPVYLPKHVFPDNVTAIGPEHPSKEFIDNMDVLLFAIPTQFLRHVPD